MRASVESLSTVASGQVRLGFSTFLELVKARLTSLVLITTGVGFYLGWTAAVDLWLLVHTLLGTAMLAGGAAALNQLLERDHDARMQRTQDRPLPAGRLTPDMVLAIGGALSVGGMLYLALGVNFLTALLGAATLFSYLFVYTPLKRVTPLNTSIGAIPGALPPLMGWTAATGAVTVEGWSLFAILFFWQLPHFMAIAWLYREDYAAAGYRMLPAIDPSGERTGRQTVSYALGLLPVSLCPFLFRLTGLVYLGGAVVLGIAFLWMALRFARSMSETDARRLFLMSIIYLPLLLGLMMLDKV